MSLLASITMDHLHRRSRSHHRRSHEARRQELVVVGDVGEIETTASSSSNMTSSSIAKKGAGGGAVDAVNANVNANAAAVVPATKKIKLEEFASSDKGAARRTFGDSVREFRRAEEDIGLNEDDVDVDMDDVVDAEEDDKRTMGTDGDAIVVVVRRLKGLLPREERNETVAAGSGGRSGGPSSSFSLSDRGVPPAVPRRATQRRGRAAAVAVGGKKDSSYCLRGGHLFDLFDELDDDDDLDDLDDDVTMVTDDDGNENDDDFRRHSSAGPLRIVSEEGSSGDEDANTDAAYGGRSGTGYGRRRRAQIRHQ